MMINAFTGEVIMATIAIVGLVVLCLTFVDNVKEIMK